MIKFEVTLKQLRAHGACVEGYNKVVSALKGVEHKERDTYIRFKHDEPIPLTFIVESNGIDDAIWCLQCNDKEWARDSRLFAVWCARQVQHLMKDERSLKALDVSEAFANGLASSKELATAWDAARSAARSAAWDAARSAAWDAARSAAWDAAWVTAWDTARSAARSAAWVTAWDTARSAARSAQKAMFIKMCNGEADWQVKK